MLSVAQIQNGLSVIMVRETRRAEREREMDGSDCVTHTTAQQRHLHQEGQTVIVKSGRALSWRVIRGGGRRIRTDVVFWL